MNTLLAHVLVQLVILGTIFAVLWWGLRTIAPPAPWYRAATVVLVLLTVIVLVNILLGLDGKQFIRW